MATRLRRHGPDRRGPLRTSRHHARPVPCPRHDPAARRLPEGAGRRDPGESGPRRRSRADCRPGPPSPRSPSRSIPSACRSVAKPGSRRRTGSPSTARHWPIGGRPLPKGRRPKRRVRGMNARSAGGPRRVPSCPGGGPEGVAAETLRQAVRGGSEGNRGPCGAAPAPQDTAPVLDRRQWSPGPVAPPWAIAAGRRPAISGRCCATTGHGAGTTARCELRPCPGTGRCPCGEYAGGVRGRSPIDGHTGDMRDRRSPKKR